LSLKLGGKTEMFVIVTYSTVRTGSACVGAAVVHVGLKQWYRLSVLHFQNTGSSFYPSDVISHILSVRLLYYRGPLSRPHTLASEYQRTWVAILSNDPVSQQSQGETGSEVNIPAFGYADDDDDSLRRNINTTGRLRLKWNYVRYKGCAWIRITRWLILLYKEEVVANCKNQTKDINTFCRLNAVFFNSRNHTNSSS